MTVVPTLTPVREAPIEGRSRDTLSRSATRSSSPTDAPANRLRVRLTMPWSTSGALAAPPNRRRRSLAWTSIRARAAAEQVAAVDEIDRLEREPRLPAEQILLDPGIDRRGLARAVAGVAQVERQHGRGGAGHCPGAAACADLPSRAEIGARRAPGEEIDASIGADRDFAAHFAVYVVAIEAAGGLDPTGERARRCRAGGRAGCRAGASRAGRVATRVAPASTSSAQRRSARMAASRCRKTLASALVAATGATSARARSNAPRRSATSACPIRASS